MYQQNIGEQLYRIKNTSCIGITDALRTSLLEALNTLLHLFPIDIHLGIVSAYSAVITTLHLIPLNIQIRIVNLLLERKDVGHATMPSISKPKFQKTF